MEEILSGAESTVTMTIFDTKNPNNTIEIELYIAEVIGGIPLEEIFTDPALCAVMKGLGLPDIITNNELAEANITTLDIQNNTAIQSLEGIQYLDKLTDLLANGCSKLTGVLDFSSKSNWRLLNLGSIPGDVTLIVGDQPNLINLSVESSNIKNLDVSECPLLEIINIGGTGITEIDLLQNPELTHAHFVSSKLTELDLSNNIDLKELHTDYSLIETIILPDETPALTTLDVKNSAIRELVAGVAPLLYNLSFRDCSQLETIDLGGSNSMTYMEIYSVYNSSLKHVRIGTFPKLASITIKDHSNIESIEIESTEVLTTLSVYNNPLLETLTLPASLPKLTTLAVHQTALEELDLPYLLPELTALNVSNTELEQFDIGIADKLTSFGINNCPSLEELIIDSAAALTELDVTFAIIENISLNGCPALKTFRVGNMDDDNTVNYGHRLVIHMESIQSIDFDVMDVRGFEIAMFYVHDDINVHSNTPEDFFETLLYTPTLRVEIHNTRGVETYEYGY